MSVIPESLRRCFECLVKICCLITFVSKCVQGAYNVNNETVMEITEFGFPTSDIQLQLSLLIIVILIVKLLYSRTPMVTSHLPESCMFILIGLVSGSILRWGLKIKLYHDIWQMTPDIYLYVLLPPIILEAAMYLCCRIFSDIFFPVLFFAFVGTILNFFIIGFLLGLVYHLGGMGSDIPDLRLIDFFLFASILVAVDPVAVLGIFQEFQVEKTLYFYVFGESLFNDAVTICIFNVIVKTEHMSTITPVGVITLVSDFFLVSGGGALIGIVFGILTSLITRFTNRVTFTEPAIIFIMAYTSYLVAEVVKCSGIFSMVTCGMIETIYAFHNMCHKSIITVRRTVKMLAGIAEAVIFTGLGALLCRHQFVWFTGFILWSLLFMFLARFVVTFGSSAFLNKTGLLIHKISLTEQFVMSYGGLRGAVSFVLSEQVIDKLFLDKTRRKNHMFETAVFVIIIFTILFMGTTMKPLVKKLKIKVEEVESLSIFNTLANAAIDHTAAGLEAISGRLGRHVCRERLEYFDTHYVRRLLQNTPESYDEKIVKVYEKVALAIHYAHIHPRKKSDYLSKLSIPLQMKFERYISRSAMKSDTNDFNEGTGNGQMESSTLDIGGETRYRVYHSNPDFIKCYKIVNSTHDYHWAIEEAFLKQLRNTLHRRSRAALVAHQFWNANNFVEFEELPEYHSSVAFRDASILKKECQEPMNFCVIFL